MKILNSFLHSVVLGAVLSIPTVYAETYRASSSAYPVGLIELYTSQGCSSCPPAEEWLGKLKSIGITDDKAIPLALHVDYWDYIGWQDQFSQKYFTKRQYKYQRSGHSSSVYTPQIMFNGEDVRRVKLTNSFNQLRNKKAAVDFTVVAQTTATDTVKVNINFKRIDAIAKNSRVVVVLAESNLVGDIETGENEGRVLKHNHVVRVWKNMGKISNKLSTNLSIKKEWQKDNLELVVIVETADMQTQQVLRLNL